MSTPVTETEFPYVGNDSQVDWAFTFGVTSTDDVGVYLALDGALISDLLNPATYTVTYDAETNVGSVKYPLTGDPLTPQDKIAIKRNTIVKQGFNYKNQAKIAGISLEGSDDNLSRQIQDNANTAKRAITVDVTSTQTAEELLQSIYDADANTNENAALTAADVVSTNADVVSTNADVVSTNADVVLTNADAVATAGDRVQTGLDRIQTGLDVASTNADVVSTNSDVVEATAQAVIAREGWKGEWLIGTTYAENEKVQYLGSSYISLQDSNTGQNPIVPLSAFWDLIALKGTDGAGTVASVVGGTNITVDNTDPANPIVNNDITDTDDLTDTATNRYTNDTDITRLANTSGTNTGDQDISYDKGYINGGVISNNVGLPLKTIDITDCLSRSQDDTEDLSFTVTSLNIDTAGDFASGIIPTLTSTRIYIWTEYNGGTNRAIFDDETGTNLDNAGKSEMIGYFDTDSSGNIITGSQVQRLPEPFETALYRGGDTLFSGSAGVSTINLLNDMNEYKWLEFTGNYNNTDNIVCIRLRKGFQEDTNTTYLNRSIDIAARAVAVIYNSDTSIDIVGATNMTLIKVVGIK